MSSIDFLEHGGGPLSVRHQGELISLPDPREMHFQEILACLEVEYVPWTPEGIPEWKRALVFQRWCMAWDLPSLQDARRLAYLVDHYRAALSHDLHVAAHLDLGELWRARRWTLLVDIIDRLPAHSWYSSAVSMDEEHARMMAESLAARQEDDKAESTGPPLVSWTPEVAALTNIYDAVRGVQYAIVATNSDGKAGEPPAPAPRPVTPLERALKVAQYNRRKAKHEALVARVLPNKGRGSEAVH